MICADITKVYGWQKGVVGILCFCGENGKILIVTREMQNHCKPSNYKSFVHFVNTSKILQVGIRIPRKYTNPGIC